MPATSFIAAIASAIRHPTSSSEPENRPLINDQSSSSDDQTVTIPASGIEGRDPSESPIPTQANYNYGSILQQASPAHHTHVEGDGHDHDEHLDGNDIDIWRGVQSQGLDGRGSIKSRDEEEEAEFLAMREDEREQEVGLTRCEHLLA